MNVSMNNFDDDEWSPNTSMVQEEDQINQSEPDVKLPVFAEIQLESSDVDAFNNLFENNEDEEIGLANRTSGENDPLNDQVSNDDEQGDETNHDMYAHDENAIIEVAQNKSKCDEPNASKTVVKLDDDLEFAFDSVNDFRPYVENEYLIKANDILCGNRPFKPNVSLIFLLSYICNFINANIY